MKSEQVRNGLLFVIAVCLVLIVLRLYSVELVKEAEAQEAPQAGTRLWACKAKTTCYQAENWVPVRVDEGGRLIVR